jgi:hypothetical protein
VEASTLNAAATTSTGFRRLSRPGTRVGILEDVSSLDIVGYLGYDPEDEEEESPVSTFHPWSLVLWLGPVEEA